MTKKSLTTKKLPNKYENKEKVQHKQRERQLSNTISKRFFIHFIHFINLPIYPLSRSFRKFETTSSFKQSAPFYKLGSNGPHDIYIFLAANNGIYASPFVIPNDL